MQNGHDRTFMQRLLHSTFKEIEKRIDRAIADGWRLPRGIAAEFSTRRKKDDPPFDRWFKERKLAFYEAVKFPAGWTEMERFILLLDLLAGHRGEGGLRK